MSGLNEFLTGLGLFTVLLLLIRLLPDFARNLTLVLASLAVIEIYTTPFFTFGLVAVTGLVYYGLFWLQWNPRKAIFCRILNVGLAAGLIALVIFIPREGAAAVFLGFRLLWVAQGVGSGRPLPSDPLEFFVYAFFFPTFFIGPLERLDEFRKNLTTEHRTGLSWRETGLRLGRIAVGLLKVWAVVRFLPLAGLAGVPGVYLGLSGLFDVILGCAGLAGYRLSASLDAFPLGTLASRAFLFHFAVVGGMVLRLKSL
ncbi:MAG TPA: hypothetical protein VLJ37_10675 [bacterium]|nr:hypothetical protein [bacterium]